MSVNEREYMARPDEEAPPDMNLGVLAKDRSTAEKILRSAVRDRGKTSMSGESNNSHETASAAPSCSQVFLSREQERELVCRVQDGDSEAIGELLAAHDGLIHRLTHSFRNRFLMSVEYEECHQCAVIGVIEAAKRWENGEARFMSYAKFWIKNELSKLVENLNAIRKPRNFRKTAKGDRNRELVRNIASLDAPVVLTSDDDSSWSHSKPLYCFVADKRPGCGAAEVYERLASENDANRALAVLTHSSLQIVRWKMDGQSNEEIAERTGCRPSTIKTRYREAMKAMREALLDG